MSHVIRVTAGIGVAWYVGPGGRAVLSRVEAWKFTAKGDAEQYAALADHYGRFGEGGTWEVYTVRFAPSQQSVKVSA